MFARYLFRVLLISVGCNSGYFTNDGMADELWVTNLIESAYSTHSQLGTFSYLYTFDKLFELRRAYEALCEKIRRELPTIQMELPTLIARAKSRSDLTEELWLIREFSCLDNEIVRTLRPFIFNQQIDIFSRMECSEVVFRWSSLTEKTSLIEELLGNAECSWLGVRLLRHDKGFVKSFADDLVRLWDADSRHSAAFGSTSFRDTRAATNVELSGCIRQDIAECIAESGYIPDGFIDRLEAQLTRTDCMPFVNCIYAYALAKSGTPPTSDRALLILRDWCKAWLKDGTGGQSFALQYLFLLQHGDPSKEDFSMLREALKFRESSHSLGASRATFVLTSDVVVKQIFLDAIGAGSSRDITQFCMLLLSRVGHDRSVKERLFEIGNEAEVRFSKEFLFNNRFFAKEVVNWILECSDGKDAKWLSDIAKRYSETGKSEVFRSECAKLAKATSDSNWQSSFYYPTCK